MNSMHAERTEAGLSLVGLVLGLLLGLPPGVRGAAPWGVPIMQPGIGAVTCAAPLGTPLASAYVLACLDLRNPPGVKYAPRAWANVWNAPDYHHPDWTAERLGCVFGLALDREGDLYAAAHGLYMQDPPWGLQYHLRYGTVAGGPASLTAAGTVYRISRFTGQPTPFVVLPQQQMTVAHNWDTGPGLGNLAYDDRHDQFFITNFEDGKIYRVIRSGAVGSVAESFDPLGTDNGAAGLPSRNELVWGIGVAHNAVFYAVWNDGTTGHPGKIRRVQLNAAGQFIASSDAEVLTVPASRSSLGGTGDYANAGTPVSDIAFSADGQTLILGERSMRYSNHGPPGVPSAFTHRSRMHVAMLSGSTWAVTRTLQPGQSPNEGESYGGVSFGPEQAVPEALVWVTASDIAIANGPHGLQGVRVTDLPAVPATVPNSYVIPFDPGANATSEDYKGSGGDVEIMPERPCSRLAPELVQCPERPGDPFTIAVQLQNLSGQTAQYGWWNPCPTNDLPPGAVTAQPLPAGIFPLPGGSLTNLGTATLNLQLPAGLGGKKVCFLLTLLDDRGRVCCTQKICVELPVCDCARAELERIECKPLPDGTVSYSLTLVIHNLTHLSANPFPFHHVTFLPPTGFSPANAVPTPLPILPGGSGTVMVTYTGLPGKLCFTLGLHDADIEPCCFIPVCLDLPDCRTDPPDLCAVETVMPCRPGPPGTPPGLGTATLHYTLCNNSAAPRTYAWSISGTTPTPPCTKTFTPADFSPASGTVTVGPGACVTIPITVTCRDWAPGECAGYFVCATPMDPGVPAFDLCCEGTVRAPLGARPIVIPVVDPPVLPPGGVAELTLRLINSADTAGLFSVGVHSRDTLLAFGRPGADQRAANLPAVQGFFHQVVELPAGGEKDLTVLVVRLGDSVWDPSVSALEVVARPGALEPGALLGEAPDLVTPVIRTHAQPGGELPPQILGLRLEAGAPPRAVLRVVGQTGARYRLERAPQPIGPWTAAPGLAGSPDAEGAFTVPAGEAACTVACEPGEHAAFFRVVRLPGR